MAYNKSKINLQEVACELLKKCFGFFLDYNEYRRRINIDDGDGARIYYVIDYDIVNLYLEPEGKVKYADFLSINDSDHGFKTMAFLLGDYFFSPERRRLNISPISSYLITREHYDELMDGLAYFSSRAANSVINLSDDDLDNLIKISIHAMRDGSVNDKMSNLVNALRENVGDLLDIYDKSLGNYRILERFSRIRKDGLKTIDNINWYTELGYNPLPDMEDDLDRDRMNEYILNWTRDLRKSGRQDTKSIRADAVSLATIQIVNQKLQLEQINARLCLITGTATIFKAASTDFSSMYLRHPQSFLMDQNFFAPEYEFAENDGNIENRTLKLFDWLNLCLPKKLKDVIELSNRGMNHDALNNVHYLIGSNPAVAYAMRNMATNERGGMSDQEMVASLKKEIEIHAASVYGDPRKLSSFSNNAADHLANVLKDLFDDNNLNIESLRLEFNHELLRILDRIYIDAGWYSIAKRIDEEAECNLKGVPALCFDQGFEKVTDAKDKLIEHWSHGVDFSDDELAEIYQTITEVDRTKYHACIIFALMFSLKGFWQPASSLAERALKISDPISDEQRQNDERLRLIKGREAAYLAAVAKRRLIRDVTDLDKAAAFIKKARDCASNDETDFSIRFDSEELAITTRRVLLSHYCQMISKDYHALNTRDLLIELAQLIKIAQNENCEDVRNWVFRQSTVNYLNLIVVLHMEGVSIQEFKDEAIEVLNLLRQLLKDPDLAKKDPHACASYLVGLALFSNDDSEFKIDLLKYERFMNITGQMPYDNKRKEGYMAIVSYRQERIKINDDIRIGVMHKNPDVR